MLGGMKVTDSHNMPTFSRSRIILSIIFILLFLTIWSVYIFSRSFSLSDLTNNSTNTHYLNFKNYGFYPVNDKGVYSFWNVCIELVSEPRLQELQDFDEILTYRETQRIVVYNSFYRDGEQELHVAGSSNAHSNDWHIVFTRQPIPVSHKFNPVTAFFTVPTCPANFHHFWIDEFVPLYTVIKQGNRLKPNVGNRVFYKQPIDVGERRIKDCMNVTRFESLLSSLYVEFPHDVFYKAPTNSCYSSGVFGSTTATLSRPRDVVDHILRFFSGTKAGLNQDHANNCSVIFLDRRTRLVLNTNRLIEMTKSLGLMPVCRLIFEDLTIKQQILASSRAKIMVGVQGAGLQWAVFMPPGSHLIEIAWPQRHWGFYFENYIKPYSIKHHKVIAGSVFPNWTTYENQVRGGRKVELGQRLSLLTEKWKGNSFDSVWKWADVIADEENFKDVLSDLAMGT